MTANAASSSRTPRPSTFSIAASDLERGEWGVAVASKFLAVGSVVSWAQAEAGAVATQSYANVMYGPDGLAMLARGRTAEQAVTELTAPDDERAKRQLGVVDARGGAAAFTGEECYDWAGDRQGDGYTCQGNILTGPEVLQAMAEAFETTSGELADRLVAALLAGDRAGGDSRGRQSAAVVVAKAGGGYGGNNDRYLDLRVDDHADPVPELIDLVASHHVFFGSNDSVQRVAISGDLARELQGYSAQAGHYSGELSGEWDQASKDAFRALVGNENLEERWSLEATPDEIDVVALEYLRRRFGRPE